jgi:hypothetical protein
MKLISNAAAILSHSFVILSPRRRTSAIGMALRDPSLLLRVTVKTPEV